MKERSKPAKKASSESPATRGGQGAPWVPLWLPVILVTGVTAFLFREFIFSDRMLWGSDTLSLGYVSRAFYGNALHNAGSYPLWMPNLLGGTPFLEALAGGDSLYPPSVLLLLVMDTYRSLGWKLVIHVVAGGLFMFGWARALDRSRAASLVAALGYALAPFLVSFVHPGHDGKLFVTALAPLLFWALEATFRYRGVLPYAGVAAVVGLVLLTTHFQMAYFLFGLAGLYYGFRSWLVWREAREGGATAPRAARAAGGRFALFLAASLLGAALSGVQLLPAYQYVTESSRRTATTTQADEAENKAYAASWSLHPEEALSFVVPEFAGNDAGGADWATQTYWGRNPFKDNFEGAGLALTLLALVGFFGGARNAYRWTFLALGTLALGYSLGAHSPIWEFFYAFMPGVSLFRAPSMAATYTGFATVTLAAFGVDRLLDLGRDPDSDRSVLRALLAATGVLGLAFLLASSGALVSLWQATVGAPLDAARAQALETARPFISRGFFLATLLAGVLYGLAAAARAGRLKPLHVLVALALLVVADGYRISSAFVSTLDFHEWSRPDPITQYVIDRGREDAEPFRVSSFEQSGQSTKAAMFGLELATGHHPNDLGRYRELIGMRGSGLPENLVNANVYRLLNVRYLVWPDAELGGVTGPAPLLQTHYGGGEVYQSLYALPGLPRARLVAEARVVPDSLAVRVILGPGFDPEREAILSEAPPRPLPGGPAVGSVRWVERSLNRQVLEVEAEQESLLVIADNWYPAWAATVDGEAAPVLRAYHTLRAVPVEAGSHTVELTYVPTEILAGLRVSMVAALILVAGVGVSLWRRRGAVPGEGAPA